VKQPLRKLDLVAKSVQELKAYCLKSLQEHEITDTPDLEARLLMQKATQMDQLQQILHSDDLLTQEQIDTLHHLLEQRLASIPMAYILKEKEFYGRTFFVDQRVLIPRPDTEILVETALNFAKTRETQPNIIDVCTGSGCVGITLSCELGYDVTLSDLSDEALQVSDINARSLLGHPLILLKGNMLSPAQQKYDIIVSNPPYLTKAWCDEVSLDVQKEPRLALEGFGEDGLDCIRTLIQQSLSHLQCDGALIMECDYRQVEEIKRLMIEKGFAKVEAVFDLAGLERVVWGILPCTNNC